tara:strand:- start:169 stop:1026 length:858 start_codon:yes stop_codon:yes gene_type:complete
MDLGFAKLAASQAPEELRAMKRALLPAMLLATTGCASVYPAAPPPNAPEMLGIRAASMPSMGQTLPLLFYVTDRARLEDGYGGGRSNAMAFGQLRIGLSGMSVQDYSAYMQGLPSRAGIPRYALDEVVETVRFPGTPIPFALVDGVVSRERVALAAYQGASSEFRSKLETTIEAGSTGKVVLYVHGFNNDFDDAAFNLLELWAASGWTGVPILFSWPTEQAGPLSYFGDTQDGAFSVYHLKETLRLIASTPGVESVTLIAHSHVDRDDSASGTADRSARRRAFDV